MTDDDPIPGDWVECWECNGEGEIEGRIPFWDEGEWQPCGHCKGHGGWVCQAEEQPANG